MPRAEALPLPAPSLTAVLFGLSGCLVDFGAGHGNVLEITCSLKGLDDSPVTVK